MPYPQRSGSGGGASYRVYDKLSNGLPAVFTSTSNRDTYFAANAGELAAVNDSPLAVGIGAVAEDPSQGNVTQWFARIGGAWETIVATLVGASGSDGVNGMNVSQFESTQARDQLFTANPDLLEKELPIDVVVEAGVIELQVWTGGSSPAAYNPVTDAVLWRPGSVRSGPSSFELADSQAITAGGDNVLLEERVRDISAAPIAQILGNHQDPAARSVTNFPVSRKYTPGEGQPPAQSAPSPAALSGSIPFDTSFAVGAQNTALFGLEYIPEEDYTGVIEYNLVNTDADRTTYTARQQVTLTAGTNYTQWFRSPASSRAGANVRGRLFKDDRTILNVRPRTDDANLPFTNSHLRRYEDEVVITESSAASAHPVTLRRDMPSEEDAQALVEASLNDNSGLWLTANDQLINSNRSDATMAAQIDGLLDADGISIPTTATAADNVRLRIGSDVRLFTANEYRVITSPILNSDILAKTDPLESAVLALQNTAFNSGRSFIRFNDGFTIDDTNLAMFEDKNIIYTAKNDKHLDSPTRPDVVLPTDAQIALAGEAYPITFEFTHLGGSAVFTDRNLLRFVVDGAVLTTPQLVRDQVTIVTKPASGEDWAFNTGSFDPNDTLLPSGVFNIKLDTPITDIATIATELAGVTIVAGDAYFVDSGGTWSGYTVPAGSVIVALVNSASLVDSTSNDDWLLLDNPRVNAKSAALLANFNQEGMKFTGNRNIRVDPANVLELSNMASGLPVERRIVTNTQGANRRISYANTNIQFSDMVGGQLTVTLAIDIDRVTGFSPVFTAFELEYPGGFTFTFPLDRVTATAGQVTSTIDIPNVDYSAMVGQDPTLQSIYYDFFGAVYDGSYTVGSIINSSTGELNQAVAFVASQQAALVQQNLEGQLNRLSDEIDSDGSQLNALTPRISPIRRESIATADGSARFLDSNGSDAFPATVASMSAVSSNNPRFTNGDVALFVGVEGGHTYTLKNITKDTVVALDDSEATVSIGESLSFNNISYFIYRVTGLTPGEVYEVDKIEGADVYAWPTDIERNKGSIARIDAELEHAVLNLDDDVINVIENEISVSEETSPLVSASDYNKGLAGGSSQTVFYEPNENAGVSGVKTSEALKLNTGDQARRKLVYLDQDQALANQTYLHAFDGTTVRDLIRYTDGTFNAQVFVPAIPAGTIINTVYPAPSNLVSGDGIWQSIPTLFNRNGIPVPESSELFFTRNIPTQSTLLSISYRGHANGNVFGTRSSFLSGVGGSEEVATSFVLDSGSETVTVEVRYYPNARNIRVSATERVNAGLPTIDDIEVILSFQDVRTVPPTPATVREVEIDTADSRPTVFAIKPSASGDLILVGSDTEIDTGYSYDTLFAADESGSLVAVGEGSRFLNYEDFEPISATVSDLENHASLPQFGLFTTSYTRETDLNIGVTIKPTGLNVSDLPTSATGLSSGDVWFDGSSFKFVP